MPGADGPYVEQIFLSGIGICNRSFDLSCRLAYELPQEVARPVIPVYSDFRGRITVTEQ